MFPDQLLDVNPKRTYRISNKAGILLGLLITILLKGCGQLTMESTLDQFNEGSVPYLKVSELENNPPQFILDTRSKEEYMVSHIPEAIWVGFESFSMDQIDSLVPSKETGILVYCSIGVRSEDIGEILIENDYSEVKNLYGGIFQWKNQGKKVIDSSGAETNNVHAYSKFWGRLLTEANKVY